MATFMRDLSSMLYFAHYSMGWETGEAIGDEGNGRGGTVSHRDTEETEEAGQARLYTEKRIRVGII